MKIITKNKFVKVAPDKLRILAGLMKGKNIEQAIANLKNCQRAAHVPLVMTLMQVQGQIKDKDLEVEDFKIVAVQINEGPKLKRRRIVHQGRSTAILKRMSHIILELSDGKDDIKKLPVAKPKATKGSK